MDNTEKIQRMIQPEALKKKEPLTWSPGLGTDVWKMFCACISGDLKAIKRLLKKDPSLVRCNYAYRTPIYFAVRENQIEVARFLLDHRADPLSLAVNDSLLENCRDRGYVEMEKLLESKLASAQGASSKGEAVAAAIREHDLSKVKSLLDASPELLHQGDAGSSQPIHWAVMTRQLDVVDELLARGADINAARFDGARPIQLTNGDYSFRGWRDVPQDWPTTPAQVLAHLRVRGAYVDICTAASIGDLERVRELLDQDPQLANRVSEYVTYYIGSGAPLKNAAARGHIEIVKLLLERGADPNLPEEHIAPHGHALYSAVANGYYEIAKLLLERGAYPNPEVESSADALSRAISNSDQAMIDLLCSYGAARAVHLLAYSGDVHTAAAVFAANPALADDPEALANAAGEGQEAFVRLMLRYQPDLPKRVQFPGWSVGAKTPELNELLFQHGLNPSQPDWLRTTPLHHFARKGDVEKAALFIYHGADLDARDEDICSTPLGWAAKFGQIRIVELLLRRGAKLNLPDDLPDLAWATPLQWAIRRGHQQIVQLMKQYEGTGVLPDVSLEQYEALAQDMVATYTLGDVAALQRITDYYQPQRTPTLDQFRAGVRERLGKPDSENESDTLTLADAQFLVARLHGFASWAELAKHIEDYCLLGTFASQVCRMIQPFEMKETRPIKLHDGGVSTTTDVWNMLTASRDGDLGRVKELAQRCPGLLTCQYDYTAPLHLAVREGHLDLVHYLVEQGALDPTYKNHPFLEPLVTIAEDHEYGEIAELLKQSLDNPKLTRAWGDTGGIDYGKDETQRRFQELVDKNKHAEVEAMLQERLELALDEDAFWGEGILMMPAKDGDRPMLELLMRYGARVPDLSKWGARYYFRNYETAVFLMENGMNPNHMNWRRFTLLHDMAFTGDVRKSRLLLDHSADINAIDEEYQSTPLGYAAHWGKREVVALLIEWGADPNLAGAPWATPLAWARKKGHDDIEADLRQAGAQ